MRSELPVKSNGLHIWTESFGNHLHAPILLIAGAGAQSIFGKMNFVNDWQRTSDSSSDSITETLVFQIVSTSIVPLYDVDMVADAIF